MNLEHIALRAVVAAGGDMSQRALLNELDKNMTLAQSRAVLGHCVGNDWLFQYRANFASFMRYNITEKGRMEVDDTDENAT